MSLRNIKMAPYCNKITKIHINNIKKELRVAETLYLATDPDREGEAISWHLYELLKEKNLMKNIINKYCPVQILVQICNLFVT